MLPHALTQVYASTLRETGKTIPPMIAGSIALLVNLVGNYVLIFGHFGLPALGVVGAAIATSLARFVEFLNAPKPMETSPSGSSTDVRAPTPSAAAELAFFDAGELLLRADSLNKRAFTALMRRTSRSSISPTRLAP